MNHITGEDLERWFTYHAPSSDQAARCAAIREAGWDFAAVVRESTPSSPDQTAAIRKIREAVMTANAAIACEEKT